MSARLHLVPSLIHLRTLGLLALATGAAVACDSCGYQAPPELGEHERGLSLGVFEQYTDFATLNEEGHAIDNPTGQWLHSSITQVSARYRFNPALSVSVFVPYIRRSFRRPNAGESETGTVEGVGDISALATARLAHAQSADAAFNASVQAGLKAPTGDPIQLKSERDGGGDEDPDNAIGGHDLDLGSGSWDILLGANAIGRLDRCFAAAQIAYAYRTEGAYQYRVANELTLSGSLGYYLAMDARDHVTAQVNVIYESKGLDRVAGEATDDTRNRNLFAGPQVDVLWNGALTALVALDLPISEHNSEVQVVPTWRLRAAVGWQF